MFFVAIHSVVLLFDTTRQEGTLRVLSSSHDHCHIPYVSAAWCGRPTWLPGAAMCPNSTALLLLTHSHLLRDHRRRRITQYPLCSRVALTQRPLLHRLPTAPRTRHERHNGVRNCWLLLLLPQRVKGAFYVAPDSFQSRRLGRILLFFFSCQRSTTWREHSSTPLTRVRAKHRSGR